MTPSPDSAEGILAACWRDFRRLEWRWHLLALAVLVAVLALRAAPILRSDTPNVDEATYERAFAAISEGRSPYQDRLYYYPPAFAFLGSHLTGELGVDGARLLFRCLNLGGAALTCWLAAAWWWSSSGTRRARVIERLLLALVLMLAAPGVGSGLATGNFSLTVSSWINLALHSAHSWPLLGGALLAASLLTKPLAAIALPVLAGAALASRLGRQIAPVTVLVAGGLAAGGALLLPYFHEMLAVDLHAGALDGTISLLRIARLVGWELRPIFLLILLAPLAFLAGRRYAKDRVALICVTLALVMFSSPAIWPYTATVFFPVPVMALTLARWRQNARRSGPVAAGGAKLELPLVAALAIAVLFLNGGAFDRLAPAQQIVLLLAQLAAPVLLAAYLLRSGRPASRLAPPRPTAPDRLRE